MSKEQKDARKKKKREERNKKELLFERSERTRRRKLSEYPEFVMGRTDADPKFISAVLDAVKQFDFLDTSSLGSGQQDFLKLCKTKGFAAALQILNSLPSINLGEKQLTGRKKLSIAISGVGSHLLSLIPLEVREKYMPYNDVSVDLKNREIRLNFSSMDSVSGKGGRIYFSRNRPTVDFDGVSHTVAFSRHSVEQICKRYNPNYLSYRAAGDVHAFFSTCVYFEPVSLFGDQPAFALYDMCGNKGYDQYNLYTVEIFGEANVRPGEGDMYYRLGYCPVVFENGFAKAKTFIRPGFRSTPEYGIALRSRMDAHEKQSFLNRISDDSGNESEKVNTHDNIDAKWFHQNGVPQVYQWKRDVFIRPKP